jgi:hypothetical protein
MHCCLAHQGVVFMNERIKELWERACTRYSVYETLKPQDERKIIPDIFAELIVAECIAVHEDDYGVDIIGDVLKKHFGVEE